MKAVRYGLIAFFCLGAVYSVAHLAIPGAPHGASAPDFPVAPAAKARGSRHWRYLPILQ